MLGRLDYRNLRWEGQLQAGVAQGIGIAMDHNRLFCLAEWTAGRVYGAMCVVYPSRTVFCGVVRGQSVEVGCFYLPDEVRVFLNNSNQKFVAVLSSFKLVLEFAKREG